MSDPVHDETPSSAENETQVIPRRSPADLLHANAGRILGDMLSGGITGVEREGDEIGPYRLCEMLGEGGFGNVWRAEQTEVVKREVAVKVIKLGMDTAQVLGRFNQERQALASLDHPNIATMLDAGVSPNGRPYFAMELVRGGAITSWCEQRNATLKERLRLFIQVCQAVHHAHEKGILHRDLKPTNILVTEAGGQPTPKIIDFGIAKAMQAGTLGDLSMLTQADQVIGTPIYMSPEQIKGDRELEASSDVYALGVVLYELLTGLLPFDTKTMSRAGLEAVKQMILETVPERPSTRVRRKTSTQDKGKTGFQPQLSALPADLDWITMKALEKDRARRYASAAELAADVQRHLDSVPVVARPPSLAYATSRWIKRHRSLMTVCVAALFSGAGVALWHYLSAPLPTGNAESGLPHLTPAKPLPPAEVAKRSVTNSLGMKFVPVPGLDVLFCIHETRRRDYAAYAAETPGLRDNWQRSVLGDHLRAGQPDNSPVVSINVDEAKQFCAWLSKKERRSYRLPTNAEWNVAAGLTEQQNPAHTQNSLIFEAGIRYPWGEYFPPVKGDGNYADTTLHDQIPTLPWLADYTDGFATTAPVMSFKPNVFGLYDIGGNVSEYCSDLFDATLGYSMGNTLTKGANYMSSRGTALLSSSRSLSEANPACGFRVVLNPSSSVHIEPAREAAGPSQGTTSPAAAPPAPSVNSLGMKFVPVSGTEVLFCIHETRRQDYAAYAAAVPGVAEYWRNMKYEDVPVGDKDDHPVVGVNSDEAMKFCVWLSEKDGRIFRLPRSEEWSRAAGLAEEPNSENVPESQRAVPSVLFPWGAQDSISGNYGDATYAEKFPTHKWLNKGSTDGFATTAPVMSFEPNPFGVYDLGGNVSELCSDWSDAEQQRRVNRGTDFLTSRRPPSNRSSKVWEIRTYMIGFRIVVELPRPSAEKTSVPLTPSPSR